MRAFRVLALVSIVAMMLTVLAAVAAAQIDNPIPEPIPDSDVEIAFETVAEGLTTPIWATTRPRSNQQLYVADQNGKVWAYGIHQRRDSQVPDELLFLDVGVDGLDLIVPLGAFGPGSFDERGLLGLAFHPDYLLNGLVYTFTSEPIGPEPDFTTMPDGVNPNHQSVIREWQVPDPNDPASVVDPDSSRVLLRWDSPQFNHNGGAIVFGRDRLLYIAVGDGGGRDDFGVGHAPGGNGQSLDDNNVLGKILRIDPLGNNSANGQYGIPRKNPFVRSAEGADEVYAYGLRNPFRISLDSEGNLWAADVGQGDIEEVNLIVPGGNHGWPVKEGTFLFDQNGSAPGFLIEDSPGFPPNMIDPIAQYDHDEGISIAGGFVFESRSVPGLQGSYVFGDWSSPVTGTGRLFHLDENGDIAALGSPGVHVTGFGQDRQGEVYVLGTSNTAPVGNTGVVLRIVPAGSGTPPTTTTMSPTTTTTMPPTTTTTMPPTTTTTMPPTTTTTMPPTTTTTMPPTTTTTMPPTTTTTMPPTTTTTMPPDNEVEMFEFGYQPDEIEIAAGETIVWTNIGSAPHTATDEGGTWNTGIVNPGGAFSLTLQTPGTYDFFCAIHPGLMDGTVIVTSD